MTSESTASASARLPTPAGRRWWLTVLLAALIFGAGMVSGGALTVVVAVHRLQRAIQHPEEAPPRIAARIARRLGLDDAQRAQVEAIVARRQGELMSLRREVQPRVVEQLDLLRDEIDAVLTDPQRERWRQMFDEFRERWLPPPALENGR